MASIGVADENFRTASEPPSDKADVILLVDVSGSMLLTDPKRLRDEGTKLLLQFLRAGDRLAIVRFAESASIVRPLTDFLPSEIDAIGSIVGGLEANGQYTDILSAVQEAVTIFASAGRENANRVVILLSDGKMEPAPTAASRVESTNRLMNEILPELKAKGTKVYTLAFSPEVDQELLKQIASSTDGVHWYTESAEKIHESFADLFLAVKKPQVVPLTSRGFRIDPDIQEATFYINREEGKELAIESPGGVRMTATDHPENIKWFEGQKFDVITILTPEVGTWQVVGISASDSFATVLTNIKLITDWASALNAGDNELLRARLFESDKPIVLPEMTGVVQYGFQVTPTDRISEPIIRDFLHDDGTHGDERAGDGVFTSSVAIEEEGEYRLRVVARGPTFERQQYLPFRVRPRLVSLSVTTIEGAALLSAEASHGAGDGEGSVASSRDFFRVQLSQEALALRDIEVKLIAVGEKRRRFSLPLTRSADNALRFDAPAGALPGDGSYEVYATIRGESKKNKKVQGVSQVLQYSKKNAADTSHEEVQEIEIKTEKKEPPPVWPGYLAILLLNAGIGGYFLRQFTRTQASTALALPTFPSIQPFQAALSDLEARSAVSEIDLKDPRITDEGLAAAPLDEGAEASGQETAASESSSPAGEQAPPRAEAAAPAEGESSEEAAVEDEATDEQEEDGDASSDGEDEEKPEGGG